MKDIKTELRIGNWIFDEETYSQVTRISDHCHNKHGYCVWESVHPIPLTPDILAKAGFRHEVKFDESYYWSGQPFQSWGLQHIDDDWTWCGIEHHPINYVHQLQNFYQSLTGKELPINLSPL